MRLLSAILFLSVILSCHGEAHYPRPRRPERFEAPNQLSNYIKELQEYYSVHGRGRFGKRQMHIADASIVFKETPFFENTIKEDSFFKILGFK